MVEIPYLAIFPIVVSFVVHYSCALRDGSQVTMGNILFYLFYKMKYNKFIGISLLATTLVGNGLGLSVGSFFATPARAAAVLPLVLLPFMLFGGLYSNLSVMSKYVSWI